MPNSPFSGLIVDKGTFYPATSPTNRLIEYRNYKKGWLIDWDIQTFWGQPNNAGAGATAPAQSYFNIPNVDIDSWVTQALLCSIQYAGLTCSTEIGFNLWPSNVDLKSIADKSGWVPTHYDYNTRFYADNNILPKFITSFRSAGIEPFLYFNLSEDWNILHAYGTAVNSFSTSNMIRQDIVLYWCLQLQELMLRYGVKMFWLDGYEFLSTAEYQKIYNAIKSIDVNCLVIMNSTGDNTFSQFPYDIGSTETVFIDSGSTAYQSSSRTHGGTTYYVPQEIVIAGTTKTSPQNWYNYDSLCVVQPVNPNMTLITQSAYQAYYDKTKAAKVPLLCGVFPDRYGQLPKAQLDLIKNLT